MFVIKVHQIWVTTFCYLHKSIKLKGKKEKKKGRKRKRYIKSSSYAVLQGNQQFSLGIPNLNPIYNTNPPTTTPAPTTKNICTPIFPNPIISTFCPRAAPVEVLTAEEEETPAWVVVNVLPAPEELGTISVVPEGEAPVPVPVPVPVTVTDVSAGSDEIGEVAVGGEDESGLYIVD
jgi:hypothetical protein